MTIIQIIILAIIQGLAELLPVSSSAHVIVAEKLMGLDPTSPEMTLLLVMLHTGTMFAVILYFWKSWRTTYFANAQVFRRNVINIIVATLATGAVGLTLQTLIKALFIKNYPDFEIEHLFGNATLMALSLAAAGLLILISSWWANKGQADVSVKSAFWIGIVQGLCLPFRGFSRSGATISTALTLGVARYKAEEFSFALAVVLTPVVIAKEGCRLYQSHTASIATHAIDFGSLIGMNLFGMLMSFVAGLFALRWLSRWLEQGRWYYFGFYCLFASIVVLWVG